METQNSQQQVIPRVPRSALVLGGGFAGLETAIGLRKLGLDVRLVSERRHLFVYPTSIWVVTGEHRIEQDLIDLMDLGKQHGFELVIGDVGNVNAKRPSAVAPIQAFCAN